MVKFSDLIKTMEMHEDVRIVVMKASLHVLYAGELDKMPLMTYMRAKDMSVYNIAVSSHTFLNIAVKEVE